MTPKRMITDKLESYGTASRQLMPHINIAPTKVSIIGREFSGPIAKARKDIARFPFRRFLATVYNYFLRSEKSLRPTSLKA
jgi:transposase-like protein